MTTYFETKTFRTWTGAKRFLGSLDSRLWIFRGQSNSNWELASTFERSPEPNRYNELFLLREFKRSASHYIEPAEMPRNTLEWLALMQHSGIPTRLLDFTTSPYIAGYFAVRNSLPDESNIAIWCCSTLGLQLRAFHVLQQYRYDTGSVNRPLNRDPEFKEIFLEGLSSHPQGLSDASVFDYGLVYPVEPFRKNRRLSSQRGLFLMTGNVDKSFQENIRAMPVLAHPIEHEFVKVVISNAQKREMFLDLYSMGISAASLFPDLVGFAQSLVEQLRFSDGRPLLDGIGDSIQDTNPHRPSRMLESRERVDRGSYRGGINLERDDE